MNHFNRLARLLIGLTLIAPTAQAAASSNDSTNQIHYPVLVVPGLGGGISNDRAAFNRDCHSTYRVRLPISPTSNDFGQANNQALLDNTYNDEPFAAAREHGFIVHATSQGTQTAFNWLAANPDKQNELKGLVASAAMASGNSAVAHRSWLFDRFVCPYLAKLFFWNYSPSGMQAIKSIEQLHNKDFPIILAHNECDETLPSDGAKALYYGLKSRGHQHVYLVMANNQDFNKNHIDFLSHEQIRDVAHILAQHGLTAFPPENSSANDYQPDHRQYRWLYWRMRLTEYIHTAAFWLLHAHSHQGPHINYIVGMNYALKIFVCGQDLLD